MNFMKFLLLAGLLFYGVYWVSTSGYAWWQQQKIQEAVKKYHGEEGYYPLRVKDLINEEYSDESGESSRYLSEIPIPRTGYCWEYNKNNGKVKLEPLPEDAKLGKRVCPN